MLPLTFADPAIYDQIGEDDRISILGLADLAPGEPVECRDHQARRHHDRLQGNHTMNDEQIEWFQAGGALNIIRARTA